MDIVNFFSFIFKNSVVQACMLAKCHKCLLWVLYALNFGVYNGEQETVFALKEFSYHRMIKELLRPFS